MGIKVRLPMSVYEDNQTCITISNNHMAQKRTRYIDIRYHFIHDYTKDDTDTIKLIYCDTKHMLADILTKTLPKPQHERLRNQILTDVATPIYQQRFSHTVRILQSTPSIINRMSTQSQCHTTTRADDKSRQATTTVQPSMTSTRLSRGSSTNCARRGGGFDQTHGPIKLGQGRARPDDGTVCSTQDDDIFSTHLEGCNYKIMISYSHFRNT